jgi:hypothetical protein
MPVNLDSFFEKRRQRREGSASGINSFLENRRKARDEEEKKKLDAGQQGQASGVPQAQVEPDPQRATDLLDTPPSAGQDQGSADRELGRQGLSRFLNSRSSGVAPDLTIRKTFSREQLEQINPDKPKTPFDPKKRSVEDFLPSAAEALSEPVSFLEATGAPFGIDPKLLRTTKEDVQDIREKARAVQAVVKPEKEFNEEYQRNQNKFILEAGRLFTNPKNIPAFVNRTGSETIQTATFGIFDGTEKAKTEFEAEEWVKEARWPEWIGGGAGLFAGGGLAGGAVRAIGKAGNMMLKWTGPTFQRYASYIFGSNTSQALKASEEVAKGVGAGAAALKTAQATARGVVGEGALGTAIGLAREPEEGESRLQNAVEEGLIFAAGGGLVRGGLKAADVRRTNKLNKALVNAAEAEGVTVSEAAETLLKNNPKARSLKDFTPENIERIKDIEVVQVPYQNFVQRNIVGEELSSGQTVFKPFAKGLEKAGEAFYNANGVKLPFGVTFSISRAFGDKPGGVRRFLFDKDFGTPQSFLQARRQKNIQAQKLTGEAEELGEDVIKQRNRIMEEFGVGERAANLRISQVLEGGQTMDRELYYLGQKYRKLHDPLEKELQQLGLLGDTRFIEKSRKKVNQMVQVKEELITNLTAGVPDNVAKPDFQKYLREWEFDTPTQMKELLEQQFKGLELDPNKVKRLFDVSRFIRTSYREAGKVHLRRFYSAHPEGRMAALGFATKKKSTSIDRAQFAERKDLPLEIRKELGEVEDVAVRVGETIGRQIKAVQDGKFFKAIAENKDWAVKKNVRVGNKEIVSSKANERIQEGWKELNGKQFGELDGHLVSPFIADDLSGFVSTSTGKLSTGAKAARDTYRKSLQAWKFGKVVLNPSTHARNMVSNTFLLDMSGVGFAEQATLVPRALKELTSKGKVYKEAKELGLFGQEFISKELTDLLASKAAKAEKNSLAAITEAFAEYHGKDNVIKRGAKKLGDFYQAEDQLFKLTKYMHMRGRGFSKEVSLRESEKWLFNYDDIPEAIRLTRDWYSPFITFISKAAPRTYETIIKQPWKIAKYGIYANAIGNLATEDEPIFDASGPVTTALGFMPDEFKREIHKYPQWRDEAVLPEWVQPNLNVAGLPNGWFPQKVQDSARQNGLTIPRLVRLPFKDNTDRNIYIDLTYMLPFGDLGEVADQTEADIPRVFFPQHPVFDALAILKDSRDPFTQKKIALPDDPLSAQKHFKALARTFMPALAPGGYSFDKAVNAIKETPDYQGRVRALPWVALDVLLGLKTRPFDLDEQQAFKLKEKERAIEDVYQEIRSIERKRQTGLINDKEADELVDIYINHVEAIGKEAGVISDFGLRDEE